MKFRKRPVAIEAEQFIPGKSLPAGVCRGECRDLSHFVYPHVHTLEGTMTLSPGDWVITGVKGEHYPCKPDVFELTYEQVDDTST